MAKGYQLIQAQTLTSTAATVTFSNIPQNFTDLVIFISARGDWVSSGHPSLYIAPNNGAVTATVLATTVATSVVSNSSTGYQWINKGNYTSNTFCNGSIYIPNYASTTQYKPFIVDMVTENNSAEAQLSLNIFRYSSNTAITSLVFTTDGNFVTNSTFYLYGVGGTRATGGTITSDANFTYHTFTSTSTFTPLEKIKNAEVLVIAGGGGGGGGKVADETGGGGGGAGGLALLSVPLMNAGTPYSVVVGSGGAAGTTSTGVGTNGTGSNFITAAAVGGGGGGSKTVSNNGALGNGSNGGSGGGASGQNNGARTGGSATAGQGNAGGDSAFGVGAGGGGAGGAGQAADGNEFYDGGWGLPYHVWGMATGTGELVQGEYYYAGGGGGGRYNSVSGTANGGRGGGGAGGANGTAAGSAATANTGGGGGGGSNASTARAGGAGGSGLIIVRYPSN